MTSYLHTMLRVTDPERTRAFYEALGLEFRREMDIVRNGEKEATNYFFGVPGEKVELEFTFNHDGRSYELGTAYGHVAYAVDDLDATLASLAEQGIEPEREPYRVHEGGSRICFVRDPDGYRIELVERR
jgi:lactoylglutathione lyase